MERMFDDCRSFSSDLSSWDVSLVKNAKFMLQNAKQFNSDLSQWNFAPDAMDGMFSGAELFSSDLNNFDVSKVRRLSVPFALTRFTSHYIIFLPHLTFPRLAPHALIGYGFCGNFCWCDFVQWQHFGLEHGASGKAGPHVPECRVV
jgi:surface protein